VNKLIKKDYAIGFVLVAVLAYRRKGKEPDGYEQLQ
jgi:hypothetical protein